MLQHDMHGCIRGLLKLHDHGGDMRPEQLSLLRLHAHVAFSVLRPWFSAAGRTEADLYLLLRLALTNVFAVSDLVASSAGGDDAGVESVAVGEAFFARASLLNHSCEPNCNLTLRGRVLELRAAGALDARAEVFTSYGPQAGFAPVSFRRRALQRRYYFNCACSACEREDATGKAERGRLRAAQLDAAAREACASGDFARAAEHCAAAIDELATVFPPGSTMIAHERAKLGRLRFNAAHDEAGRRLALDELARAAELMRLCYGDAHEEVDELRRLHGMVARQLA